jgi:hypothetical protein
LNQEQRFYQLTLEMDIQGRGMGEDFHRGGLEAVCVAAPKAIADRIEGQSSAIQ